MPQHLASYDPTAEIKALLAEYDPYEPYLRRKLLLAGQFIVQNPTVDPMIARYIAREIYDLYMATIVPTIRDQTVDILKALLDTELKPAILTWVRRMDGKFHAYKLGRLVEHPAVRDIILAWVREAKWLNELLVSALKPVAAQPEVRNVLLGLLTHPKDDIRAQAASSLRLAAGEPIVRDKLIAMLSSDPGKFVPRYVALALGPQAADPSVFAALQPLYQQKEWRIDSWLKEVFKTVLDNPSVLGLMEDLLSDQDMVVRKNAVQTLSEAPTEPGVQLLLLRALTDPDPNIRYLVMKALHPVASSPVVQQALLETLTHSRPVVTGDAATALKDAEKSEHTVDTLLALLDDRRSATRAAAACALVNSTGNEAVYKKLVQMMHDRSPLVQTEAATAFLWTNESTRDTQDQAVREEAKAVLLSLLLSPKARVRASAAHGLRPLTTDPEVQSALLPLLKDKSFLVRYNATLSLHGVLNNRDVQAAFVENLSPYSGTDTTLINVLAEAPIPVPAPSVLVKALARLLDSHIGTNFPDVVYRTLTIWADTENATRLQAHANFSKGFPANTGNDDGASMRSSQYEPFLHQGLLNAGRQLQVTARPPGATTVLDEHAAETVRELFNLMMEAGIRALIPLTGEVLRGLLNTEHRSAIVACAVNAAAGKHNIARLGELSSDVTIQQVLLAVPRDPGWKVRKSAAKAIAPALPEAGVQQALLSLLSDSSAQVRKSAASLLRPVASVPVVRDALLQMLSDPAATVRFNASGALQEISSQAAVREALLNMLENGSPEVQLEAGRTLAHAPYDIHVRDGLLRLLASPDERLRHLVVAALTVYAEDELVIDAVIPLVKDLLTRDPADRPRIVAINLLGHSAYLPRVSELFRPLVTHRSAEVRDHMIYAMAPAAKYPVVQELLLNALLTDVSDVVRRQALRSLTPVVGEKAVRDAFFALLDLEDEELAGSIMRALTEAAASSLSIEAKAEVLDALLPRLHSPNLGLARSMAYALTPLATEPQVRFALEALIQRYEKTRESRPLSKEEQKVRHIATTTLGKGGYYPLAWQTLLYNLDSTGHDSRVSSANAAGEMVKEPFARDALRPLLTAPKDGSSVRKAATMALERAVPDPWLVPALGALLENKDIGVAEAAYKTLLIWFEYKD